MPDDKENELEKKKADQIWVIKSIQYYDTYFSDISFTLNLSKEGGTFKSDFVNAGLELWQAYGGAMCNISVAPEASSGKKVMRVNFDDTSPATWCSKGAKIQFASSIPWSSFNYIYNSYHVDKEIIALYYVLQDSAGNRWVSLKRDAELNNWGLFWASKKSFTFSYNIDPNITSAQKIADITGMYVYVVTSTVNSGEIYNLHMDEFTFNLKMPSKSDVLSQYASSFDHQWEVNTIDSNGNLTVDGQPFFPLMLYSCIGIDLSSGTIDFSGYTGPTTDAANLARFQAVKDAGFNTIQSYTMNLYGQPVSGPGWSSAERSFFPGEDGETTHELYREGITKFMDYANQVGLKAMIGAYSTYSISKALPLIGREDTFYQKKLVLSDNINALKNHPALLMWYFTDEPSSTGLPLEDVVAFYKYIKELDLSHPLYIASADQKRDMQYLKAIDIIAPDLYPIANGLPIIDESQRLDDITVAKNGNMPLLWHIVQIGQVYSGASYPTTSQMRLMSFQALTRDVKGLAFYAHENLPDQTPATHWANVNNVIHSVNNVTSRILTSPELVTGYTVSDNRVASIMRKHTDTSGIHYLLIAVNPIQDSNLNAVSLGTVTIDLGTLPITANSVVKVMNEDAQGNLQLNSQRTIFLQSNGSGGYMFTDNFGGFAAHAYKIEVP